MLAKRVHNSRDDAVSKASAETVAGGSGIRPLPAKTWTSIAPRACASCCYGASARSPASRKRTRIVADSCGLAGAAQADTAFNRGRSLVVAVHDPPVGAHRGIGQIWIGFGRKIDHDDVDR